MASYLLQEPGSNNKIALENGTGFLLLEEETPPTFLFRPFDWQIDYTRYPAPGKIWYQNLLEGTLGFPLPVVSPATFTIVDDINKLVGHVIGTNAPISFTIISGNSGGFFSIDPAGEISTTTVPAPTGTYTLGVTATNVFGPSPPATITIFLVPEYPILMGMIVM